MPNSEHEMTVKSYLLDCKLSEMTLFISGKVGLGKGKEEGGGGKLLRNQFWLVFSLFQRVKLLINEHWYKKYYNSKILCVIFEKIWERTLGHWMALWSKTVILLETFQVFLRGNRLKHRLKQCWGSAWILMRIRIRIQEKF